MDRSGIVPHHTPVLLAETLDALGPRSGGRFMDCTAGLGGHSEALLEASPEVKLCALDRDPAALALCQERLGRFGSRVHFFNLPFARFSHALDQLGWPDLRGVLLDLGVSSLQLDDSGRGFSFHEAGPLDMRMGAGCAMSAREFVNTASQEELRSCIAAFGEDPLAGAIARMIVERRANGSLETTEDLARAVLDAYPAPLRRKSRRHPATRTFQAIRMRINDELGQLAAFLDQILPWLARGGRLAVISFHSLEDRLVKRKFRLWSSGCLCGPHVPVCSCGHTPETRLLHRKPVEPTEAELAQNPRARSARLRAVEKIA